MSILDLYILICAFSTCLRLVFYHRKGSTFKRGISILAYLFIVGSGSMGLMVLTGQINTANLSLICIAAITVVTLLVYHAQGNVSLIVRSLAHLIFKTHSPRKPS